MLATQLPLQEFGFAAGVTGALLLLFLWFVRAARQDVRAAGDSAQRASHEFTEYLKDTAGKQTEVLVGVANVLERTLRTSGEHEERAAKRHEEVMRALREERPRSGERGG